MQHVQGGEEGVGSHGGSRGIWLFGIRHSLSALSLLLLETVWMAAETKLPFSATQGPSHFLCQATALTHRPFCLEHPELCAQQRASLEAKGKVRRREVWKKKKKWEEAFVKGLTIVSPCCPHHLPSFCCSVLPVAVTPGLFLACCSAVPRPTYSAIIHLEIWIEGAALARTVEHNLSHLHCFNKP